MLYLEMPAGVGYSYLVNPLDNETNDDQVASENLAALLNWFEKFSDFKDNKFIISGESYAGVYVPTLVEKIDKYNTAAAPADFKFNLDAFIVGNGVTTWADDTATAQIGGGWGRTEMSINLHNEIVANGCDYKDISFPAPVEGVTYSDKCIELFNQFEVLISGLNFYDEYRTCWTVNDTSVLTDYMGETTINGEKHTYRKYYSYDDYTPWLFSTPHGKNFKPLLKGGSCTWGSPLVELFNDPLVRTALHIVP